MCGRYQFTAEQCEEIMEIVREVEARYGANAWRPGEIRPTALAPVLVAEGDKVRPELKKWGYQMSNSLVINARAETVTEKPLFRYSVASRRCIVPSTGFYEWDREKRKYFFTLPGEDVLYMAGLYEERQGRPCYCILTTDANESMAPVHHRMPLVLPREQAGVWLCQPENATDILHLRPPQLERTTADAQMSLW